MLTDEEREQIRLILEQDKRPWAKLGEIAAYRGEGFVASMIVGSKDEANAIAADARNAGLDVEVEHTIERSGRPDLMGLTLEHFAILLLLGPKFLKHLAAAPDSIRKIPGNWKKLVMEDMRPRGRRMQMHEALLLVYVDEWLNRTYGVNAWSYDVEKIRVKPIGDDVMLFRVVEQISGDDLKLSVKDGEVERLLI